MTVQFTVRGGLHVTVPEAMDPAAAKMSKSLDSPQSIPDSNTATVAWSVADYQTAGPVAIIDLGGSAFIAPAAGVYQVTGNVRWEETNPGSGLLILRVLINGSAGAGPVMELPVVTPWAEACTIVASSFLLANGDAVTFQVEQNTGDDLNLLFGEATIQRVA